MKLKSLNVTLIAAITSLFASAGAAFCQDKTAPVASAAVDPQKMFSQNIETARKLFDMVVEFLVKYSFQVLGGIVILIIGHYISKISGRFFGNFLRNNKIDVTISKFLVQALQIFIMAFAALIALGSFGITIAPLIAGLSVAGFGLSFALQGPLSNYAAGMTLVFTKPFKVGDIIEVTGVMGEVQDMSLARTEVKTVDGTSIVIPNKQIIGEIIHNYTEYKKLDIKVGVDYGADIKKAAELVRGVVSSDSRVASLPPPKVGVSDFADSSVTIYARIWCRQRDYWDVLFDVNMKVYDAFKANGITIPFPQRDVHIIGGK